MTTCNLFVAIMCVDNQFLLNVYLRLVCNYSNLGIHLVNCICFMICILYHFPKHVSGILALFVFNRWNVAVVVVIFYIARFLRNSMILYCYRSSTDVASNVYHSSLLHYCHHTVSDSLKPCFHYSSWRPVNSASGNARPSTRPVLTGNGNR